MMVKALDNQSLLDIAVQTGGSIEVIFELCVLNDLSVTDRLTIGQELVEATPVHRDIVAYYSARDIRPATEIREEDERREGIEFWAIETEFVVNG
ncbi:MAG: hypothetical protein LBB85_11660 [Dysgonamonadaceae bacterium]|jgi:hypothetical protein|nr:hypothetical protein [Dysgonamonadaceae bacterium]